MPRLHNKQMCSLALYAGILSILSASRIVADPITYLATVNTSGVQGTSGFLDFDFAPGNDSQFASVKITNFFSDGSLVGAPQVSGDVTGLLSASLTIDNSTQFNDYFQGFNYGTTINFLLTFGGGAVTSPNGTSTSGSTFGFGMFDSTGNNPLLTTDPNGNTFTVALNLDGSATPSTFPSTLSGGPAAATVQATPEPSSFVLLLIGLAGMLVGSRRCQSRQG